MFFIPFLQNLTAGVLFSPVSTQFPLSLLAKAQCLLSYVVHWSIIDIRDTLLADPYAMGLVCGLSGEAARGCSHRIT